MLPADANSQPKTVAIKIELPASVVDGIRARVASGEFASESDVVTHLLLKAERMDSLQPSSLGEDDEWEKEVRETVARLDRGEEPTYTIEEIRQHLEQRRAQRAAA